MERFERLLLGNLDWYAEHAAGWKPKVEHCHLFRREVIDDFAECLDRVGWAQIDLLNDGAFGDSADWAVYASA